MTLARWQHDPIAFIEECLIDPESNKPFVLSEAERWFLKFAFQLDADGRLKYPEMVFGAIKKSGKTTLAAIIMITMILLFGGRFAEGFCIANDLEQAAGRVFAMIKRIIAASPLLKSEAKITADKILFPALDASIIALASNAASAAGANPTFTVADELWAATSERSRRLFDEMVPSPARKVSGRLVVSYAGFSGESVLLEEIYNRGMALPEIGPNLHAGEGMLFAWHTGPISPWQTPAWIEQMRASLRPAQFARMIENRFISAESTFVDMAQWDACVVPTLTPSRERQPVWIGIDASAKLDSTALVCVGFNKQNQTVQLVQHKVFTPSPGNPVDFEQVERTILDWSKQFFIRKVLIDPWGMTSTAQRLAKAHIRIEDFATTQANLTQITSNLFSLITEKRLVLYPDAGMRLAASRAVVSEGARGFKIDKVRHVHHIDVIISLAMAALAAVKGADEPSYSLWGDAFSSDAPKTKEAADQIYRNSLRFHIYNSLGVWPT
jgi:phage terminase large subunit-like protein